VIGKDLFGGFTSPAAVAFGGATGLILREIATLAARERVLYLSIAIGVTEVVMPEIRFAEYGGWYSFSGHVGLSSHHSFGFTARMTPLSGARRQPGITRIVEGNVEFNIADPTAHCRAFCGNRYRPPGNEKLIEPVLVESGWALRVVYGADRHCATSHNGLKT